MLNSAFNPKSEKLKRYFIKSIFILSLILVTYCLTGNKSAEKRIKSREFLSWDNVTMPKYSMNSHIGQLDSIKDEDDDEDCKGKDDVPGNYCDYLMHHCKPPGYINYLNITYCTNFGKEYTWSLPIFAILLILFYFFVLGKCADDFFCPILEKLSVKLNMSQEIAGFTILALGNGAPDVSSTFAAVTSGTFGIAAGELLGAGLFVCTIVVSSVTLVSKGEIKLFLFLRDAIVYTIVVCIMTFIIHDQKIYLWEAVAFLFYYIVYLAIAIVPNYIKKNKDIQFKEATPLLEDGSPDDSGDEEGPWSFKGWKIKIANMNAFQKLRYIITYPIYLLLCMSLYDANQWNRISTIIMPIGSAVVICLGLQSNIFFGIFFS